MEAEGSPTKKARSDPSSSGLAVAASPLQSNFEVYVSKDTFKFNAAHFVAFEGFRERLHGHNYRVGVRLLGSRTISHDGYVIDFGDIKNATRKVCKQLNDHFLCPMRSDVMTITEDDKQISLKCQDGSFFSFPISDVAKLPLVHATSEELAIYLWGEILSLLDPAYLIKRGIHTMETIVTEAPGQEAVFRWPIPPETSQQNLKLDVRQFVTKAAPCPTEQKQQETQNEAAAVSKGCCPDCEKSKTAFAEQLEKLAKAINEKGGLGVDSRNVTKEHLESLLK